MSTDPTPLKVFLRPERRFVAEGRPAELVVLIRLLPSGPAADAAIPLNLAYAVDGSAKLSTERLLAVKQGLHGVVDALRPTDTFALVVAGPRAETLVPAGPAADRARLHAAIDALQPAGGGPLFPAWVAAGLEASSAYDRGGLNRVVVIGAEFSDDGSADRIVDAGRGLFRRGVSTTTIGVGDGFREDTLVPLAVQGGGNASYVRSFDDIVSAISGEISASRRVFSEWATLRFDLEDADVVDVLNDLPWIGDQKVSLPPLYAETPLNIVVRMRIRPTATGADIKPLTVRIKNLDLHAQQAVVHRKAMTLHVVSPALADGMAADIGVQAHAARLEFARMHAKCVRKLDDGDLVGARQLLDFSMTRFQSLSGQSGGTLLTEDLGVMARLRERLSREADVAWNRKLLKYSAAYAQRGGLTRIAIG